LLLLLLRRGHGRQCDLANGGLLQGRLLLEVQLGQCLNGIGVHLRRLHVQHFQLREGG